MISFLLKKFVKDYQDTSNRSVRQHYGSFAGTVGIICNVFLFFIKLIAGLTTGSVAIVSDAFNNLSDAGSSIITLFGFHLAAAPADSDHPYGHGRIEYITGLAIAFVILFVGIFLFKSSVEKIFSNETTAFTTLSVIILLAALAVKYWMYHFYTVLGKSIDSVALLAAASDSRSDCLTTIAVLIGIVIQYFTHWAVDGYFGLGVSVFILYSGYQAAMDSISPLIGKAPDEKMIAYISALTHESEFAHGYHNLMAHNYGPGNWMITFDVVLDENLSLKQAHDIISLMEKKIEECFSCSCTIHPDPYDDHHED